MTEEPRPSPRGSPPPKYAEEPAPQPSPIGNPPPTYPEEPEPLPSPPPTGGSLPTRKTEPSSEITYRFPRKPSTTPPFKLPKFKIDMTLEDLPKFPVWSGGVEKAKSQIVENPEYTVIIPVQNFVGCELGNCLRSLELQTTWPIEIIVADYGSTDANFEAMMKLLNQFECTVYRYPKQVEWSLCIARNMGLRRAGGRFAATLDADMILEPKAIEQIIEEHKKRLGVIIRAPCFLPDGFNTKIDLPLDYDSLKNSGYISMPYSLGGFISASTSWWHKIQGFDERMGGWGADDMDLAKRASLDQGLNLIIDGRYPKRPDLDWYKDVSYVRGGNHTKCYHQPHQKLRIGGSMGKKRFEQLWKLNRHIYLLEDSIVRNHLTWGIAGADEDIH